MAIDMKALVRKELVLLYRLEQEKEKGAQIIGILEQFSIPYRQITEDMLGQTLGWCASEAGYNKLEEPYRGEPFPQEVMVFSGISGKRLEQLLAALKTIPAGSVALKAVVTPHNKSWPVCALFAELSKEHRMMGMLGSLKTQIKKWEPIAQKEQGEGKEALLSALHEAGELLKAGADVTPEACEQALSRLKEAGEAAVKGQV